MARGRLNHCVFVLTLVFGLAPGASGETFTWTGQVGDSWSQQVGSQTNWAGNVIPLSADTTDLVFNTSTTGVSIQDLLNPFVLHSMTFEGDAFKLSGSALTFAGSDGSAAIVQNSANTQDLSLDMRLSVPTTIGGTGTGTVVLRGQVTGTSLTANVPIDLEASGITLSGSQTYNAGFRYGSAAVSLYSSGGGDITLAGPVDGAAALSLTTSGVTRLGGIVGGVTRPASLNVFGQGSTRIDAGLVQTTGPQSYNTPVTLGADTTLVAGGVTFYGAVNGAARLTVTGGTSTFRAPVGAAIPLTSVSLDQASVNDSVTTVGGQFYGKLTNSGAAEITLKSLAGGDIVMTSASVGAPLTVSTSGVTRFVGSQHNLGAVTTDAPGSTTIEGTINARGAVTFNDPVTLTGDTTLSSANYDTTFAGPIDGDASFGLSNVGKLILDGPIGHTVALKQFIASGTSVQFAAGSVTTSMDEVFSRLILQGDASLTSTAGGKISVGQAIGNFALAIHTAGATSLGGSVTRRRLQA